MPKKSKNYLNLYATPQTRADATTLIHLLTERGVNLLDQRGNPSYSALVRYLIAEELKRIAKT